MLLEAQDIRKAFGDQHVLRGVSIELAPGQSLALTGESGSGKSTLIHILAGLDTCDSGEVRIGGQDPAALSERQRALLRCEQIGIVFQQFNLIPSLNAGANLRFQAQIAGRLDEDHCQELAEKLGLREHLHKYPEELSGGQQQRVAIGRALAARPRVVLADEPTGNLDEETADTTLELFLALVADERAGLIIATHSSRAAGRLDRAAHLRHGVLQ